MLPIMVLIPSLMSLFNCYSLISISIWHIAPSSMAPRPPFTREELLHIFSLAAGKVHRLVKRTAKKKSPLKLKQLVVSIFA